jgi:hypothetical protein
MIRKIDKFGFSAVTSLFLNSLLTPVLHKGLFHSHGDFSGNNSNIKTGKKQAQT